jgi:hypothetical protein
MERVRPACAAAAVLALAVPALAAAQVPPGAPAVALNSTCFTPGDPMVESGSGFTPGAPVNLSVSILDPSSTPLGTLTAPVVTAAADGTFARALKTPALLRDADRREMATSTYADQLDPTKSAIVHWTLSAWGVRVPEWNTSNIANPRRKMTIDATGWTNLGPSLYAHYFRSSTKVKSVKLGALTGDCKDLKKRVRQFPFKEVKPGQWTVYFSTTAVFDKRADAWSRYRVRVPKTSRG